MRSSECGRLQESNEGGSSADGEDQKGPVIAEQVLCPGYERVSTEALSEFKLSTTAGWQEKATATYPEPGDRDR